MIVKWLFRGVDRGSNNCFLVECENNHRDHHTLIPLIKRHVRPGTLIITDGWKAYFQPRIPAPRRQPLKKLCEPNYRNSHKHNRRMLVPCQETPSTWSWLAEVRPRRFGAQPC